MAALVVRPAMTPAAILAQVATWPQGWQEAHAERVAIKVESGISEDAALLQAWQEYRARVSHGGEP